MIYVIGEVVEKHVAKPGPDHKADNGPDEIVFDHDFRIIKVFFFYPVEGEKVDDGKGHNIHHAVVAHLELSNAYNVGINIFRNVLPEFY